MPNEHRTPRQLGQRFFPSFTQYSCQQGYRDGIGILPRQTSYGQSHLQALISWRADYQNSLVGFYRLAKGSRHNLLAFPPDAEELAQGAHTTAWLDPTYDR